MAIKHPMGMERRMGVNAAIPKSPYLFFTFTQRRLFFVNTFLGFFLLNNPVFLLNQFHILNIPELKYIKTTMPKVPEAIPNKTDSQKLSFSLIIKKGTVIANLKEAIMAAIRVSNQVVSIRFLFQGFL